MNEFDVIIALCMGIGLAAASGFRVFLPPFLLSIAVRADAINVDLTSTHSSILIQMLLLYC
jgi:hypothetical protein